ncbi:protein kinase family protein [Dietzia cinnamea]|uniref:protein kinase family protein n=1 Tax=Dietzia cinnamea TaxID=321318 RepID=UPI00223BEC98|nr:protein kinase family protein [Dietzia cinnamea]MCT2061065.1 protein kinase family protein [Dietzia cinnamea]MCT2236214.1 protein kinase family protein [Dietzia cinnamea]MCT2299911.1 protein kinase family protein [Dietzia cinnamea]
MGDQTGAPVGSASPTPPRLTVGGLVSGGRYELLEPCGGVAGQAFWKARDRRLDRFVALTFVDPLPGEQPPGSATGVLDRTVALTSVYSDGLARVLDVIRGRAGGIVVTEWIPGRSLAAAVAEPDPDSAVGAVWGLSDAATRAEEAGLALGLDSPDRVRLTEDGRAVLSFPGVRESADARADVRGLGAVLYALLTGTWPLPLPDGSDRHDPADGRPGEAPRGDDDEVLDPTVVGAGVSPESAVLAMRTLDGSSVSSAATVRSMVADRVGGPVRAARVTRPVDPDPAGGAYDGAYAGGTAEPYSEPYSDPDPETQKRRWQIMAGTSAAAVVVIVLVLTWLLGGFGGTSNNTPLSQQLDAIERAAQASRASQTTEPAPEDQADADADTEETERDTPDTPVEVSTVTTWQPASSAGTAENSASAPNVADGDRSTSWSSDTYRAQIGDSPSAYKPGIGLMFTLDGEQEVRRVVLHSEDDDVRFEVRSATSATPSSLDETTRLGTGTVRDGEATVTIDEPEESRYLLVWITRLGTSGAQAYDAEITEVELTR